MASRLDELIINLSSRCELDSYLTRPAHSLILVGVSGVGLGTIAKALGYTIAGSGVIFLTPTTHKQQKTSIINADDIADLIRVTRDKRNEPLAIIIDGADQTAPGVFERLLKLIEEPVPNIYYIITTHNLPAIPATIVSRSSVVRMKLPSETQCASLYNQAGAKKQAQIKFLAHSQPAEIKRLLSDDEYFESQATTVRNARDFLTGNLATRLELVNSVKNRDTAINLCNDVARLVIISMERDTQNAQKWAEELETINRSAEALSLNANLRLQLLNLALSL